jgi:hypothetical protein
MNQLPVNHRSKISSFVDQIRCDEQAIPALAFTARKNDVGDFFRLDARCDSRMVEFSLGTLFYLY